MNAFLKALAFLPCLLSLSSIINSEEFKPDYKLAIKYSLLYYEAQRSGKLPENKRIKWRGDSALDDKGANGEDLSGGYYDGSDFVKLSFPMAYATAMLSWGVLSYKDVYKTIGQYSEVLEAIKWATDYFIKCHVSSSELYGQVGDFTVDHKYWGRPEEMNLTRLAFQINKTHPGSDLAGEVSAALSSASMVFQEVNETYSRELFKHSQELYSFAKNFRGLSKDVIPGAREYYSQIDSYDDKLVWAATWLFKATNDSVYLQDVVQFYKEFGLKDSDPNFFYFEDQVVGIRVLLAGMSLSALIDGISGTKTFNESVTTFCDYAVEEALKTPKGLIFIRKLETLPLAANIAFLCLEAAKLQQPFKSHYVEFAKTQIDYILGSTGKSYLVGYGKNYPKRPLNVASSCPDLPAPCDWSQSNSSSPNPQILYGALVSGPNSTDHYIDRREDIFLEYNVVSIDFNAGFQNALAGLIYFKTLNEKDNSRNLEVVPLLNNCTDLK